MNDYQYIKLSRTDRIGRLAFNRPPLNILTIAMMREISAALNVISNDQTLRVLVFEATDGSKAFSAGVDIADHTPDKVEEMLDTFHQIFLALSDLEIPTLAIVDGIALGGGCELALFCDMIIASEQARFGQPEIQVGVFPPVAAIMLPGIVGPKIAAELLLTGKSIDAQQALQIGLVNRMVPSDKLTETTDQLLAELVALSGAVLRLTKRAYRIGTPDNIAIRLAEAERLYLDELMPTHDAQEGLTAFTEKRAPIWTDN